MRKHVFEYTRKSTISFDEIKLEFLPNYSPDTPNVPDFKSDTYDLTINNGYVKPIINILALPKKK